MIQMHFTTLVFKTIREHHEAMTDMLCKYTSINSEMGQVMSMVLTLLTCSQDRRLVWIGDRGIPHLCSRALLFRLTITKTVLLQEESKVNSTISFSLKDYTMEVNEYTVFHPLVVDVVCVLFWTQSVCMVPNQNTRKIYRKQVNNGVELL